jgi:hypothetical protein
VCEVAGIKTYWLSTHSMQSLKYNKNHFWQEAMISLILAMLSYLFCSHQICELTIIEFMIPTSRLLDYRVTLHYITSVGTPSRNIKYFARRPCWQPCCSRLYKSMIKRLGVDVLRLRLHKRCSRISSSCNRFVATTSDMKLKAKEVRKPLLAWHTDAVSTKSTC